MPHSAQELREMEEFNMSDEQDGSDTLPPPRAAGGYFDALNRGIPGGQLSGPAPSTGNLTRDVAIAKQWQLPDSVTLERPFHYEGARITGAEADAIAQAAIEKESILHFECWSELRKLVPQVEPAARKFLAIFAALQEKYMPIWNPRVWQAQIETKIKTATDANELITLNGQLQNWNAKNLEIEAQANAIWNRIVVSHWHPLLDLYIESVSLALQAKFLETQQREAKWLKAEFGLAWQLLPATQRVREIQRRFGQFVDMVREHASNPARQFGGQKLAVLGGFEMIGDDANNRSITGEGVDLAEIVMK